MKVTVDLDPRDVWRIQQKAEESGMTAGDVLRHEIGVRRPRMPRADRDAASNLQRLVDRHRAWEARTLQSLVIAGFDFPTIEAAKKRLELQRKNPTLTQAELDRVEATTTPKKEAA